MIARCRERVAADRLHPHLIVTPLHALAPRRHYRTVVACGVFGLGSSLDQDAEALQRLPDALLPGGG